MTFRGSARSIGSTYMVLFHLVPSRSVLSGSSRYNCPRLKSGSSLCFGFTAALGLTTVVKTSPTLRRLVGLTPVKVV